MKSLHKILKISAKEAFKNLRKHGPYFCVALCTEIHITSVFWNHIVFSKERDVKEVQERMLIVNIIPRIFEEGFLQEKRDNFLRIVLELEALRFVVILEKTSTKIILLSCFRETKK